MVSLRLVLSNPTLPEITDGYEIQLHHVMGHDQAPPACDFRAYKDQNRIERMFNRINQFRRVATRYDKTRKSFDGFLALAAAKIWLPYFVNRT